MGNFNMHGDKNVVPFLTFLGTLSASKSTVLDNICDLFTASGGCYAGYQCSLKDGKATCE